mgnify:FL=1|jgi:hypothetical protein
MAEVHGNRTTSKNAGNNAHHPKSDAKSGALSHDSTPIGPDLATIINAWPALPEAVKDEILAMVGVVKTRGTN